ncbi:RCC1 repeat-containing protein [Pseudenhygromyxa sp. WMMC2535]|uniref:RCC1 domain-containing protein n=1 Tax=Pseudenhygromyxa sp. WMMC2535 TaxID=2712867 RepID=UPI0015572B37|nr:RCC1 repeat-containing protein [Pseudenhygromyxa sp. WMMC2535]NVB37152.1 RCC1 repeat-containing protein [Pseudenhygromyxa sp. WMMC2535]
MRPQLRPQTRKGARGKRARQASGLGLATFSTLLLAGCSTHAGGGSKGGKQPGGGEGGASEAGGSSAAMALTAGRNHSCVLRGNGTVACWGANGSGQLGDGSLDDRSKPVTVQGLSDAVELALGERHSCARRRGGAVVCWGANDSGQLGSGHDTDTRKPVSVRGLEDAVAIASGDKHSCALRKGGAVVCWGANADGQLGNLTRKSWTEPAPIRGLADAVGLAAGARHSCARRSNGGVICWGANDSGQLGDGTTKGHERPSSVVNLPAVIGLAAAGSRTCAFNSQALLCWGDDGAGKTSSRPVKLAAGSQNDPIAEVALGDSHGCMRHRSGLARCWGDNRDGRLGDGSFQSRSQPVSVVGLGDAKDLALGEQHSCALRTSGAVVCWGSDAKGALGQGESEQDGADDRSGARRVLGVRDAVDLGSGDGFSCAVSKTGAVLCWGRNDQGQLGDVGGEDARPEAKAVSGIDDAVAVGVGLAQACAVSKTGAVYCWGSNDAGQLGRSKGAPLRRATKVPQVSDAVALAMGYEHACALRRSGEVQCWGSDAEGQLGDGAGERGGKVVALSDATALSAGRAHTCALRRSGSVYCWGANNQGQIGNGAGAAQLKQPVNVPAAVAKLSDASEIAMGPEHGCARKRDGKAVCWGRNDLGQLGSGTASSVWTSRVPVRDLAGLTAIGVGPVNACAASGQRMSCWGDNAAGQCGFTGASATTPRPGLSGLDVASFALGKDHACARLRDGEVACWGDNAHGQLGDGGRMVSARPLEVEL